MKMSLSSSAWVNCKLKFASVTSFSHLPATGLLAESSAHNRGQPCRGKVNLSHAFWGSKYNLRTTTKWSKLSVYRSGFSEGRFTVLVLANFVNIPSSGPWIRTRKILRIYLVDWRKLPSNLNRAEYLCRHHGGKLPSWKYACSAKERFALFQRSHHGVGGGENVLMLLSPVSITVKCQKQLWCHVLPKIGAVRQLAMQSELINQIKSAEFYCIILFLYTIISSKKGICHIIVDLLLLYVLSSFLPLLKRKYMRLNWLGINLNGYSRKKRCRY